MFLKQILDVYVIWVTYLIILFADLFVFLHDFTFSQILYNSLYCLLDTVSCLVAFLCRSLYCLTILTRVEFDSATKWGTPILLRDFLPRLRCSSFSVTLHPWEWSDNAHYLSFYTAREMCIRCCAIDNTHQV